ncbi:Methylesterase domain-containing protein, CheB-like [Desulfonema limicola]|uniref:protein-glutamate methylesterase n=1 Tax=Desulfonema limicola TaxID=45656 RepID=A0A975GJW0_9BACT|nr:chemotaxis protein CheB [Desulfonema limicola]QTA83952.1 Methylesterase domain-containing protein, CheB-like [Desulfonema limicola]
MQKSPMIAIGSSTGGPDALAKILSCLPESLNAVIVIIQHVDEDFSSALASWLDSQTPLKVKLAGEGAVPQKGTVYVAGTNSHLIINKNLRFSYISGLSNILYHPSIDIFFKSIALNICQSKQNHPGGMAVLLTGMGRDGAKGMLQLRNAGWHTIAQDKTSSAVYGMPKAAAELKAASEILHIDKIAPAIIKAFGGRNSKQI